MRRRGAVAGVITLLFALGVGGAVVVRQSSAEMVQATTVGQWPDAIAVDASTGRVFVANAMDGRRLGTISVLDAASGVLRRTQTVGVQPVAVVVDARRDRVLVANQGSNTVSILDAHEGRFIHAVGTGPAPTFAALDEVTGRTFVTAGTGGAGGIPGNPGRISVIDTASGTLLRTVRLSQIPMGVAVDERVGHVIVPTTGTGACTSGACRSMGSGNSIQLLDARTGALLHTASISSVPEAIAVDNRAARAFITSAVGAVIVIDTRSGRTLRAVRVAQGAGTVVADAQSGRVFVVQKGKTRIEASTVSVLDAGSGRLLRATTVGHVADAIALSSRSGRVFVANGIDSTVSVLDARSGRLMGTVRVVAGPIAMAVDDRRGRVFVAGADVSNGPYSDTPKVGEVPLFARLARTLADTIRTWRKGRTGSVAIFAISAGR